MEEKTSIFLLVWQPGFFFFRIIIITAHRNINELSMTNPNEAIINNCNRDPYPKISRNAAHLSDLARGLNKDSCMKAILKDQFSWIHPQIWAT